MRKNLINRLSQATGQNATLCREASTELKKAKTCSDELTAAKARVAELESLFQHIEALAKQYSGDRDE